MHFSRHIYGDFTHGRSLVNEKAKGPRTDQHPGSTLTWWVCRVERADCLALSEVVTTKMFLLLLMNPRRPNPTMEELTAASRAH